MDYRQQREAVRAKWIVEAAELSGLRKAEVETLRSFLSRQNDIFRASYGRRVTPHPRQCVFFGTTNAETGYLRDITGNRRFWPVKTASAGDVHSWDINQETVDQIWAETMYYFRQGEPLYLPADIEQMAKREQMNAMESDEREGIIQDFLDKPLPVEWDDMNLRDRQEFAHDEESLVGDKLSG